MRIHNCLPQFTECMRRWIKRPSLLEFNAEYYRSVAPYVSGVLFDDEEEPFGTQFYAVLAELNWKKYRDEVLSLDPAAEEARVKKHLQSVQDLFGFELQGEIVLFGAFACMDGYARFDQGSHRVFIGADESHANGSYLDVLITHELTHVARESRPEVWQGWGLNPAMSHDEFTENQPVIEHLLGEGFSCAVSEILVPGQDPWHYAYQTKESLAEVLLQGPALDRRIRQEIALPHADSDYTRLYDPEEYGAEVPGFSHYVWAWQWAKSLLRDQAGGDPRQLVNRCSKELMQNALSFKLERLTFSQQSG
jgi:hypothetical protein